MTDDLAAEVQRLCGVQVTEAHAAGRVEVADELRALLADEGAMRAWVATHGLAARGPALTLAVLTRDLRGTCSLCGGPAEFVGDTGSSALAEVPAHRITHAPPRSAVLAEPGHPKTMPQSESPDSPKGES